MGSLEDLGGDAIERPATCSMIRGVGDMLRPDAGGGDGLRVDAGVGDGTRGFCGDGLRLETSPLVERSLPKKLVAWGAGLRQERMPREHET